MPRSNAADVAPIAAAMLALGAFPLSAQPAPMPAPAVPTDAEMVRTLLPTVVNIRVVSAPATQPEAGAAAASPSAASPSAAAPSARSQPRVMSGSGFVVDPSGLIVTNDHVIDGAYDITVTFSNGETEPAHVVEAVRMLDLALLQVPGDQPRTAVRWGDGAAVQSGDQVYAFGNPLGLGLSVTAGIVSAVNRDIQETLYDHFIQTDAVINHGNSGGPLFNLKGEVVGVDTAIISPTAGYAGLGFAIPADTVRFFIDRIRQYGCLRPGWVGIRGTVVTRAMAEAMGDASPQGNPRGVMISVVAPGSPAAKAGLGIGNIVLRFGTVVPTDERALQRAMIAAPVGAVVPVLVRRGGQDQTIPITVSEWPPDAYDALNGAARSPARMAVRPDLGLTLSAITDATLARHNLPAGQTGVVVTGVIAGTDAWLRGLATGDVIMRVQDAPVTTAAQVQHAIDAARAKGRSFALFLVRQKDAGPEGPQWMALRIAEGAAAPDRATHSPVLASACR